MTCTFQKQKRTKGKKSWKETSLQSAHRKVVLHQQSKGESKLKYFFALLKVLQNQIIEKRLCSKKSGAVTSTAKWHTCLLPTRPLHTFLTPTHEPGGWTCSVDCAGGGGGEGMVTGKLNYEYVTLLLDLYCFSALKVDEPEIYGKSG